MGDIPLVSPTICMQCYYYVIIVVQLICYFLTTLDAYKGASNTRNTILSTCLGLFPGEASTHCKGRQCLTWWPQFDRNTVGISRLTS